MKIYAVPEAVPFPKTDYSNYDFRAEQAREDAHREALKAHLIEMGHKGKHTGKIARFGVADGYAQYMLADRAGRYGGSFLIHLPYGDGYQFPGVKHYPKSAIVENILAQEKLAALFSKKMSS